MSHQAIAGGPHGERSQGMPGRAELPVFFSSAVPQAAAAATQLYCTLALLLHCQCHQTHAQCFFKPWTLPEKPFNKEALFLDWIQVFFCNRHPTCSCLVSVELATTQRSISGPPQGHVDWFWGPLDTKVSISPSSTFHAGDKCCLSVAREYPFKSHTPLNTSMHS